MSKSSIRALVSAVIAAAYGLHSGGAVAVQPPTPNDTQDFDTTQVWSTINRINANNPSAYLKVSIAREAGQSELISAIVEAAAGAANPADIDAAIEAAMLRIGGLNARNVVSLEELLAALRAMGLSDAAINAAINAYSLQVADAVATGKIKASVAAAVLSQDATKTLYG